MVEMYINGEDTTGHFRNGYGQILYQAPAEIEPTCLTTLRVEKPKKDTLYIWCDSYEDDHLDHPPDLIGAVPAEKTAAETVEHWRAQFTAAMAPVWRSSWAECQPDLFNHGEEPTVAKENEILAAETNIPPLVLKHRVCNDKGMSALAIIILVRADGTFKKVAELEFCQLCR